MNKLALLPLLLCFEANAFSETRLDYNDLFISKQSDVESFNYYQPDPVNEVVLKSEQTLLGPVNNWMWGTPLGDFTMLELAAVGLSYWGATNPSGFAWFSFSAGVGALTALPEPSAVIWTGSLWALSEYNFKMDDEEDLEEEDIFVRNFLAINAIYATFYVTDKIFPALEGDVVLFPDTEGNWYLNYRYSF